MTCRNISCKAEFCWVCLGPWDQHGSSWYNCNRFNEADSKVARESQSKSRAQLARYLFYCNRYLNHAKSRRLEHKLFAMVQEKRAELEAMDVPQVEVRVGHQGRGVANKAREAQALDEKEPVLAEASGCSWRLCASSIVAPIYWSQTRDSPLTLTSLWW